MGDLINFFSLIFATPNIKFSEIFKYTLTGFTIFYLFDVLFAISQIFMLTQVLSLEYFIRFISVFIIWIFFSYEDYLKKKFSIDYEGEDDEDDEDIFSV